MDTQVMNGKILQPILVIFSELYVLKDRYDNNVFKNFLYF